MSFLRKTDVNQILQSSVKEGLGRSQIEELSSQANQYVRRFKYAYFILGIFIVTMLIGIEIQAHIAELYQLPDWTKWAIAIVIFVTFATLVTQIEKWES